MAKSKENHVFEIPFCPPGWVGVINSEGLFTLQNHSESVVLFLDREQAIEMCQEILGHYARTWAPSESED